MKAPSADRMNTRARSGLTLYGYDARADDNSPENVYIQSATLHGKPLEKNWITYGDIARGGVMRFEMGPEPNKSRCTSKEASPFSLSRPE